MYRERGGKFHYNEGALCAKVLRFLRDTEMPVTLLGRRINSDPRLVTDLLYSDRRLREVTYNKIMAYIDSWPAGQKHQSTHNRRYCRPVSGY